MTSLGMGGGEDGEKNGIEFIALPSVDLRCFTGDELLLAAQLSGHFPDADFHDIVIPKIDREIFNESAGSRKQTYSNSDSSDHFNRVFPKPTAAAPGIDCTSIRPARVIRSSHFGESGALSLTNERVSGGLSTRISDSKDVARVNTKRKGKSVLRNDEVSRHVSRRKDATIDMTDRSPSRRSTQDKKFSLEIPGSSEESLSMDSEERKGRGRDSSKRARDGKAPSRRVANGATGEELETNSLIHNSLNKIRGFNTETSSRKKCRQADEALDSGEAEEVMASSSSSKRNGSRDNPAGGLGEEGLVKAKKGTDNYSLLDAVSDQLARRGDDKRAKKAEMAERVRKRAGEEADTMDRLAKMKGTWSSAEHTLKIVDAKGLPVGWTVSVGLRRKYGRTLFEYRDWRSPEGKMWPSFKDATTFLLSTIGHYPTSEIVPVLKPPQDITSDGKTSIAREDSSHGKSGTCRENRISGSSVGAHMNPCDTHFPIEALDDTDGVKGGVLRLSFCNLLGSEQLIADKTQNKFRGVRTGDADPPVLEESNKKLFETEKILHNWQCAHKICRTTIGRPAEKHYTRGMTKTCKPSQETDFSITEKWLRCREKSCHSNIMLTSNHHSHNCSSCGMMFWTQLKLHKHLRRAKHVLPFKCDVCERHFSSITLLLGHRVKVGHPRVTKAAFYSIDHLPTPQITSDSIVLDTQHPVPVARSSSVISNIVFGLLSDTCGALGCNGDHQSVMEQLTKRSVANPKEARNMVKKFQEEVRQIGEKSCHGSDVFECKICHKIFYLRPKYWGHLSVHSKVRKKHPNLSKSAHKRLSSRIVDKQKFKVGELVTGNNYIASAVQSISESVFWKLLDDF